MTQTLDLGPESAANSVLAVLRHRDIPAHQVLRGTALVPGLFLDTDPDAAVTLTAESPPGMLLSLRIVAGTPAPRWIALHVGLQACDLSRSMLLGLALRSRAPGAASFRLCLRSGQAGGFADIFFRKTVLAHADAGLHLDALLTADHPALLAPAPWRELILFFEPATATITLEDLRLFTV